jgi:high-affinity nickel-transport protein
MPGFVSRVWNESDASVRGRVIALYVFLVGANVLVWFWAFVALRDNAVLFGSAFLAYSFGLRHAVDADHIAAIDNSTRKLMQQGQRPVGVGFFFSLGHSLVVLLLSIAVGFAASQVSGRFDDLKAFGDIFGTLASALFLFLLAAFNIVVLISVWRTFQGVKRGAPFSDDDFDILLNSRGFMAPVPAAVQNCRQKLAPVPNRVPVRSRLRHGNGGGAVRHIGDAGRQRRIAQHSACLSSAVHRGHDAD